jgi:hypothetical protein
MEGLTCLVSPPERMWCPDDNMADYSHILIHNPPRNYAFWERVAAKPTGATCAPAAPV